MKEGYGQKHTVKQSEIRNIMQIRNWASSHSEMIEASSRYSLVQQKVQNGQTRLGLQMPSFRLICLEVATQYIEKYQCSGKLLDGMRVQKYRKYRQILSSPCMSVLYSASLYFHYKCMNRIHFPWHALKISAFNLLKQYL